MDKRVVYSSFVNLCKKLDEYIKNCHNIEEVIRSYFEGCLSSEDVVNVDSEDIMKYKGISVRRRNDNRWVAVPTVDKKKYFIYGKTQVECYQKLREFFRTPIKKLEHKQECITFYKWLDMWVQTYKVPTLKPNSVYQIENCIKNHIKPYFEDVALNKVTSMSIDVALNKVSSSRMKKYTFDVYVESLRQAYKNKLIKEDVSSYINKVHHIREKGRSLTAEERLIFLQKCDEIKYGAIFKFMYYSGCRPQGARNLKWCDIKENQIYIDETKSKNGQRYIPYFESIKKLLSRIDSSGEYVFNISESTIKVQFNELKAICGFSFTQKDLRHTFATMCAESGINENTIAKWMGHGSPSTTRQYYIQVLSEFELSEIDKVNNSF